jgi:hypothetical protein
MVSKSPAANMNRSRRNTSFIDTSTPLTLQTLPMRFQKILSQISRVSATDLPPEIPRWLWYGAWGALSVVVCGGLTLAFLLANGAADPPRAGPLVWQSGPLPTLSASPNYTTVAPDPIPLFRVPYTLEIAARFSVDSDPAAAWGIMLDPAQPSRSDVGARHASPSYLASPSAQPASTPAPFEIAIIGQRFFAVSPASPDWRPFIHIRPLGTVNLLRLDVDSTGHGTLRINDEIAWRGTVPAARSARLYLRSRNATATLNVKRIAVYAPDEPSG